MFRFSEFPPEARVRDPRQVVRRTANAPRSIVTQALWWRFGLLLLVAAAFLIRSRDFGNPLIDSDEQFYLLAGDRLLHGTLPYVDLWDRKPVGLFLLYGAIRLLGGDGIIQYQLVATAFVAATALTIATMARRIAPPGAALVAGFLYIPALAMSGGEGGQAPIFFNLLVALAAWLTIGGIDRDVAAIRGRGIGAMLLLGAAMQIKYSVLAEGVYFGLVLSWLSWRADPRWPRLLVDMSLWCGLALLPTLAAFGWYAAIGRADAFVYANFVSIFQRGAYDGAAFSLYKIAIHLLPLLVPVILSEGPLRRFGRVWRRLPQGVAAHRFIAGWAVVAVLSFLGFGGYFDHYALPLFVPLAILAAPMFAIRRFWSGALLGFASAFSMLVHYRADADVRENYRGDAQSAAAITRLIDAHRGTGCLYVFDTDPIYYHLTGSCLPTRWVFPYHLSLTREAPALGVDPATEIRRILDSRPSVIVDKETHDRQINPAMQAIVERRLARDYRLVGRFPREVETDRVWALRSAR
jgi:4-amino-4-deoxy-L-arabinose transferase-like glycosyltransferase